MPVPDRRLRAVLGGLCLLAGAALVRQIAMPPWPRAAIPVASSLSLPEGYQLKQLEVRGGERQRDWARSRTRRILLVPGPTAPGTKPAAAVELTLTRLVAREPDRLQVAELTRSDPALSLRSRRLLQDMGQEQALGTLGDDPTLQGCVVAGGSSGITASSLGQISGPPPRDPGDRLQRLLGLRPHRTYACVLLSLRGTNRLGGDSLLRDLWSRLGTQSIE
ncbi:hypothetical protein I1E95_11830 [Synechococcus sp. CBW1107]|uniref:hypothetical protein n=1 Tax=Synechococcus sp. CBW1107 TaxID=2789857 RepID=UPI0018CC967E|nr:hypothetical protein [Synechococcus sp. CBW1107]QPN55838.1 hypothetical protein I1E95_11830 [Synechococcus sp. CBW1107]